MIDFEKFINLKAERNSAKSKYEYSVRSLNNVMKDFNKYQQDTETSPHEEPSEDSKITRPSASVNGFLTLVVCAKEFYDAKAEFEKLDNEYQRQSKILDLEDSIDRYIGWITNANYTDYNESLKRDFSELMKLIK